eukprot:UN14378
MNNNNHQGMSRPLTADSLNDLMGPDMPTVQENAANDKSYVIYWINLNKDVMYSHHLILVRWSMIT